MSKKLKILFSAIEAVGHMNACVGLAQVLIASGHECIFSISKHWEGKLVKYGIKEHLLANYKVDGDDDPGTYFSRKFIDSSAIGEYSALKKRKAVWRNIYSTFEDIFKVVDNDLEGIIRNLKPDVIIVDNVFTLPCVVKSGIP